MQLAEADHSDPLLDQAQSTTRFDRRELHRVTQATDDYAVLLSKCGLVLQYFRLSVIIEPSNRGMRFVQGRGWVPRQAHLNPLHRRTVAGTALNWVVV